MPFLKQPGDIKMKLSKLDPMTILMLVVAFGVVITMLTQNSVASVDRVASETRVNVGDVDSKTMRISFDAPVTVKKAPVKKVSKSTML